MLSDSEVVSYLNKLTYKPSWNIEAYKGDFEGPHVVIRGEVPDSYNPGKLIVLEIHSAVPPALSIENLQLWLLWRIDRIENHEIREWLKEDGVPIFNPHSEDGIHDRQLRRGSREE